MGYSMLNNFKNPPDASKIKHLTSITDCIERSKNLEQGLESLPRRNKALALFLKKINNGVVSKLFLGVKG